MPRRLPWVNKLPSHLGDGVITVGLALVAVHLLVFVGFFVVRNPGFAAFYWNDLAVSAEAVLEGRVWTVGTYGLVHDPDSLWHLLGNVFALYVFGPPLEARWGKRRWLQLFGLAVLAGGLAVVIAGLVGFPSVTVGASAGTMALLAAWSWTFPQSTVMLMFFLPVAGRHLLPMVLGIDALMALSGSDVSWPAHAGGVLAAWLQLGGRQRLQAAWVARKVAREKAARLEQARRRFKVIDGGKVDEHDIN